MFDNMARQVMRDAETLASNDGDYVRLHHIAKALLTGQGISNTVLKSFGMTKDTVPPSQEYFQRFFKPWKTDDEQIYVGYYSPEVVSVWYHAQCLLNETGRSDATEFFLIGLLEEGGAYAETLRSAYGFTMKKLYSRIQHLQAVSLWSGYEPEAHARRFFSLAQGEVIDGNFDQALRLVNLAITEARQAKDSSDHRRHMARAQTVKQASRFYATIAESIPEPAYLVRAKRYEKLAQALSADVLKREDDNWQANQLGFTL